jgi:hypothetical protein
MTLSKDEALTAIKEMIQEKVWARAGSRRNSTLSEIRKSEALALLERDIEALLYGVRALEERETLPDISEVISAWTSLKPWDREL